MLYITKCFTLFLALILLIPNQLKPRVVSFLFTTDGEVWLFCGTYREKTDGLVGAFVETAIDFFWFNCHKMTGCRREVVRHIADSKLLSSERWRDFTSGLCTWTLDPLCLPGAFQLSPLTLHLRMPEGRWGRICLVRKLFTWLRWF